MIRHGQSRKTLYQPMKLSSPAPLEAFTQDRVTILWWAEEKRLSGDDPHRVIHDRFIAEGVPERVPVGRRYLGYTCFKIKEGFDIDKDAIETLPVSIVDGADLALEQYEAGDEARMPTIANIPRARRPILKAEAKSLRHLLTHKPKNPLCEACCRGKMCAKKRMGGAFNRELKGWG